VAVSGGNHAEQWPPPDMGLKSVILMPETTPANYVDATRGWRGDSFRRLVGAAFAEVAMRSQGWAYIHPLDDPIVIAGQGTIGLEILDDVKVTDIIVSVGGGLIGSRHGGPFIKPTVRIWGVETEGADCMSKSLCRPHPLRSKRSLHKRARWARPAP
jgi:threonine dehydratase